MLVDIRIDVSCSMRGQYRIEFLTLNWIIRSIERSIQNLISTLWKYKCKHGRWEDRYSQDCKWAWVALCQLPVTARRNNTKYEPISCLKWWVWGHSVSRYLMQKCFALFLFWVVWILTSWNCDDENSIIYIAWSMVSLRAFWVLNCLYAIITLSFKNIYWILFETCCSS